MTRQRWAQGLLGAAVMAVAAPAFASQPGACTQVTVVTAQTILSTSPARVCSVEMTATGSNGWAQVFDATTTSQARTTIAEPGQATSGNTAPFVNFGERGHVTDQGLGVDGANFRVVIRWGR